MDFSKIKFETLCNKAKILNAAASSIILCIYFLYF